MLIVVPGTRLVRTPVYLGNDDGISVDNRHLIMELSDFLLFTDFDVVVIIYCFVATAIPTCIVMHRIADIIAFDRVGGIAGVV